jgi:iron(III) transport system ATP-binding protein
MRFEVRRLHDAYRYTTVYVTHDQSEAMTTADVIAVMNAGKVEQLGPPQDIYDRPRSEFVARFIGSSNIVKGKAVDESHVAVAGVTLRCVGAKIRPGAMAAISIRQHDIGIATEPPAAGTANFLPGIVTRNVFLGNSRDYMVEAADGTALRVVTSPQTDIAEGSQVWLSLPPERCRALEDALEE